MLVKQEVPARSQKPSALVEAWTDIAETHVQSALAHSPRRNGVMGRLSMVHDARIKIEKENLCDVFSSSSG